MSPKVFDPLEYLQIIDPTTIIRPAKLQLVSDFSSVISYGVAQQFSSWLIEQQYTVTEMVESKQGPGTFYTKPNNVRSVFLGIPSSGELSWTFVSITRGG